jgi:hypothetical protein
MPQVKASRQRRLWSILFVVSVCVTVATWVAHPPAIVDLKLNEVRFGDLPVLSKALEFYTKVHGEPPTDAQGLTVLAQSFGQEKPSILSRIPKDPWIHDYVYRRIPYGKGYEIYSKGRNGLDEHGAGDDITEATKAYNCAEYGLCWNWFVFLQKLTLMVTAISGIVLLVLVVAPTIWRKARGPVA